MDSSDVTMLLQSAARTLAMIPTALLVEHVDECNASLRHADSFGAIIDPTAYRAMLYDGSLEDAKAQLKIAEGLLMARQAIDQRELSIAKRRANGGQS